MVKRAFLCCIYFITIKKTPYFKGTMVGKEVGKSMGRSNKALTAQRKIINICGHTDKTRLIY